MAKAIVNNPLAINPKVSIVTCFLYALLDSKDVAMWTALSANVIDLVFTNSVESWKLFAAAGFNTVAFLLYQTIAYYLGVIEIPKQKD